MGFRLDVRGVGASVQQTIQVGGVVGLELEHPGAVGVLVEQLGAAFQILVGGDHLAGDGRVDVGGGLHRLDHGALFLGGQLAPDHGVLDEDHVAEQILGVVGDADADDAVGVDADPFMGLGVFQIAGNAHCMTPC